MPSVGKASSNTAKRKIKRNLLMKLNGNLSHLSLPLTDRKTESSELKNLFSQCSYPSWSLGMELLWKLEFISGLVTDDKNATLILTQVVITCWDL